MITLFSVGTAISYTVYSLRKESSGGLDPFYGVMATYVATGIALYILGQIIV